MKNHFRCITFFFVICLFAVSELDAQTFYEEMLGFRLNQLRNATHNKLGTPNRAGSINEEMDYEMFALNEEGSIFVVFQYLSYQRQHIYSIQVTSYVEPFDPGFRRLKFGMTEDQIIALIGKPDRKVDAGEHGHRWEFKDTNFSIEVNKNRLSSIRVRDDHELHKEPSFKSGPDFESIRKSLMNSSNAQLADLLMPDVELYINGAVHAFMMPLKEEIEKDTSKIFANVRELSKELSAIDINKEGLVDEQMRISELQLPMRVIKFPKNEKLKELVLKWYGSKWRIWEFDAGRPDNNDIPEYKPGTLKGIVTEVADELIKTPNVLMSKSDGKPLMSISYNSHPTLAEVVFTGETRPVSESRITMLKMWLSTFDRAAELADRFQTEYKFTENGDTYWIPLPKVLENEFADDVKKGARVKLKVAWFGLLFDDNGKHESFFIINDYMPEIK